MYNLGQLQIRAIPDSSDSSEDSDSDSSDYTDYTSTLSLIDSDSSTNSENNNKHCKKELQRLLDSSKPIDREELNVKIIEIVKKDNKALFMYLIANNYKLEVLNKKGQTALHLAWYYGKSSEILDLIIDFPNYVTENHTDCNGLNYLHIASSVSHVKLADVCLKAGVDVNSQFHTDPKALRNKFTPLHFAACKMLLESRKVIKLLLKNGADVNALDYMGRTPLHIACRVYEELFTFSNTFESCSSVKFVKILVENGSDPSVRDKHGNTALLSVIPEQYNEFKFEGDEDSSSLPYEEIRQKIKYFFKKDVDFAAIDNDGNNILHRLIENLMLSRYLSEEDVDFSYDTEYAKIIKQILTANKGIDVNAKNFFGDTPLRMAVSLMSFDIVKLLLDHNASLSSLTFSPDDQYCFCYPNEYPNLDVVKRVIGMVKLLLKKGWKLTFEDNLPLMKFLAHCTDSCECENAPSMFEADSRLHNHADYCCALHFKKIFDKVMSDMTDQEENFTKTLQHFTLLVQQREALHEKKILNLYMEPEIHDMIKTYTSKHFLFNRSITSHVKDDIVRMKYIKCSSSVSLYDVMTKHPHRIYGYIKNKNFNKITEHFKSLEHMVKGHVAKSLIRHYVEKMALGYLRIFLPLVPYLCCKQILSYLCNLEIINLCSAAILEDE